jgi:hypothetical protein
MNRSRLAIFCLHILLYTLPLCLKAQDTTALADKCVNLPSNFIDKVNKKASLAEKQLTNKTEKYLAKLQKQEARLKKKLAKIDSLAANNIFNDAIDQYDKFQQKLGSKTTGTASKAKQYLPFFDTLKTTFKFLEQHKDLLKNVKESSGRLKESMSKLQSLDDKLAQAENIKQFVKERRQLLAEQLKKFGLAKELTKYNKRAYYYGQQIQEYKSLLNEPDKLLEKSVGLLNKLPIFREFISKHSELAALFPMPENNGLVNSNGAIIIPGLQTRAQVQQQLQAAIAAGGPNAAVTVQQNIQSAQAQLNKLKDKLNQLGGGNLPAGQAGSDFETPEGFKPNNQKVNSIWKRLEYGTNLQSTRANAFLPTTTDIGLSIAYKLNDKSQIGFGSSAKIGWGNNIRNIRVSGEGFSLRSFVEIKLKGSFNISGGYEQNFRTRFYNTQQLRNQPDNWFSSGLIGVSKTVSVKSKFFKKTKIQLMYDMLWKRQVPVTQPVVFRTGYSF